MKNVFIFILLCLSILVSAQKYDYNWVFGYDDAPMYNVDGLMLNFNKSPLIIERYRKNMEMSSTAITMSDSEGKLLFYSNGCKLYNSDNILMENGDVSSGDLIKTICNNNGKVSRAQFMVSLPFDSGDSIFYLIQQKEISYIDETEEEHRGIGTIIYSKIDMRKNDGLGSVTLKSEIFYQGDTIVLKGLTAVKHENTNDWWIILLEKKSNNKLIFLFSNGEMKLVEKMKIGNEHFVAGINQACFSPDGNKFLIHERYNGLQIYDFNRNTGELSNFIHIPPIDDTFAWGGCAFSPDGKLIYISHHYKCFQYNLESEDIAGSVKLVGQWDGYLNEERYSPAFGQMQLAPDCRIYVSVSGGLDNWHIIHNPNEIGLACNLETHIPLPWVNGGAVGNFPNYRLGNEPVCDSTLIGLSGFVPPDLPDYRINVTSKPNEWKINMYLPDREKGNWILKDMYGHVMEEKKVKSTGGLITDEIDLDGYPNGIYYWEYYSESGKLITGKVMK